MQYYNYNYDTRSSYQEKSRRELIQEVIDEWSSTTTSHGLPRVLKSKSIFLKVMWLVFFFASLGVGSFVIIKTIQDFNEHKVVTKIRLEYERPIKFPAVTICNLNPYVTEEAMNFLNEYPETDYYNYVHYLNIPNDTAQIEFDEELINQIASDKNFDKERRKKFGLDIQQMIIVCKFNQKVCNFSEFEHVYYAKYGNCFKFNSGFDMKKNIIDHKLSFTNGESNGLNLQLYLGNLNFTDGYIKEIGFRIFVHDQSIFPSTSEGVHIEPGKCANIVLNKIVSENKPKPFSRCIDLKDFKSDLYDHLKKTGYSYRQKDCYELHYQEYINENCHCYDTTYPILDNNLKPCYLNATDYSCYTNKTRDFFETEANDEFFFNECPLECSSTNFDLKISTSDYPSLNYYTYLLDKLSINIDSQNVESISEFKKTFACANIYYDDLKYTDITEEPKITQFDLVSLIGGTLGLFIGISILSLAEVIELMIEIAYILIY